nr:MAG TPA: holin [Caudoviricetes sp.]
MVLFLCKLCLLINRKESEEMKKMNYAEPIIDAYNAIAGTVIAVLSYILGDHWILFLAFLLLNVADWLTGWMKSRIAGKENSAKGWQGVLKKLGYWVMIMVGFGASAIFIEIGVVIGVDLQITTLLGWFVLASLLINEIRSIVENFVEAGYDVPKVLVKGLEVADKVVNKDSEDE